MRIHAIDGSILLLPGDRELREHFGTAGFGSKSAAGRGSILYDILNDLAVDAQIEPMKIGEPALAQMHMRKGASPCISGRL